MPVLADSCKAKLCGSVTGLVYSARCRRCESSNEAAPVPARGLSSNDCHASFHQSRRASELAHASRRAPSAQCSACGGHAGRAAVVQRDGDDADRAGEHDRRGRGSPSRGGAPPRRARVATLLARANATTIAATTTVSRNTLPVVHANGMRLAVVADAVNASAMPATTPAAPPPITSASNASSRRRSSASQTADAITAITMPPREYASRTVSTPPKTSSTPSNRRCAARHSPSTSAKSPRSASAFQNPTGERRRASLP